MAEMVKSFPGFWSHGQGDQILGRLPKIGVGWFKGSVSMATALIVFIFLLLGTLFYGRNYYAVITGNPFQSSTNQPSAIEYHLTCPNSSAAQTCIENYPQSFHTENQSTPQNCPDYFRWIHHDLNPWKNSGITREMIERGKPKADFRLVIVDGKAYVEKYRRSFQTRDLFTIWGFYQLLRLYPGSIPDLDLLFNCGDQNVVMKADYRGPNASSPPPVFHYCGKDASLAIVFPDWSFWGWAEINIKPWEATLSAIKKRSKKIKWEKRIPFAYWKGNPYVAQERQNLLKCNVSEKYDWGARIYSQDWAREIKRGFKHSKLEDQCKHRYKIYIEGVTWSVSQKYILACDSMTLLVKPKYHDFYSRNMMPLQHYWPIRTKSKCKDLKFAVEWGNNHTDEAKAIGKAGSKLTEDLTMQSVYDYMHHLLNEYAKLMKFKPTIPPKAEMLCSETTVCREEGLWKKFMIQSMVKSPSKKLPCVLPPPYKPQEIQISLQKKQNITRQVEMWEADYWKSRNNKQ